MKILVSNLPPVLNGAQIAKIFNVFGTVTYIKVFECAASRINTGSAIVEMPHRKDCDTAISVLNGLYLEDKPLMALLVDEELFFDRKPMIKKLKTSNNRYVMEN